MKWKIRYTNQVLKFLEITSIKSVDNIIIQAIKKVIYLEDTNINIKKMKGDWKAT